MIQPSNATMTAAGGNNPVKVAYFPYTTALYIRVAGAGVWRFAATKDELQATSNPAVGDGLTQQSTDAEKERFWQGDLWAVCDTNPSAFIWSAPQFQFFEINAPNLQGVVK
jgi:hypothetical protein